jgi:hypothetical protein
MNAGGTTIAPLVLLEEGGDLLALHANKSLGSFELQFKTALMQIRKTV